MSAEHVLQYVREKTQLYFLHTKMDTFLQISHKLPAMVMFSSASH